MKSWSFRTSIYQKVGATFWMYLEWKSSIVTPLLVFKRVFSQIFFNTNHPEGAFSMSCLDWHFPWRCAPYSTVISVGMIRFLFGSSAGYILRVEVTETSGMVLVFHVRSEARDVSLLFWSCDFYIARSSLRSWKQPRPTKNGHIRWCLIGFFSHSIIPNCFSSCPPLKWLSILRV